jgi:rod shape-determining protein MreC
VKVGDLMTTSGLDGVYPPGLPVAKVTTVERRGDTSFARVNLQPVAQTDSVRHVLILQPMAQFESARAEAAEAAASEAADSAAVRMTKKAEKAEARAAKQAASVASGAPR